MKEEEEKSFHSELINHQTQIQVAQPQAEPKNDQSHQLAAIYGIKGSPLKCNINEEDKLSSHQFDNNNNNGDSNNRNCFISVSASASCSSFSSNASDSAGSSHSSQAFSDHSPPPTTTTTTGTLTNSSKQPSSCTPTTSAAISSLDKFTVTNCNVDQAPLDDLDESKNNKAQVLVEELEKEEVIYELRFLVRRREAGALIGKRGTHIKRLRETFRSSMFSIPDTGNGPERVVCITTNEQSLDPILADLTQLLMEKSPENDEQIELKLLIHSSHAGSLIGIGGQSIKRLRNDSKAAIKIYEMCCPLSNERVCAIKAKPPVVVSTIKLIQTILRDNPIKGTTKPYDALHFDLNLVDKYGGYFPDDSISPCLQQQQQQASSQAGASIASMMMRHYCEPELVYSQNQHHQHHLQHPHPRHQGALMHSMGIDTSTAMRYQEKHCSVWRAPSTKRDSEFHHRADMTNNKASPNGQLPDINHNTLPDLGMCHRESVMNQDDCMNGCKSTTTQHKPLKTLPSYYHQQQAAARLAGRFHPYTTSAPEHHHNQHQLFHHNLRYPQLPRERAFHALSSPYRQHYQPGSSYHSHGQLNLHQQHRPQIPNYMRGYQQQGSFLGEANLLQQRGPAAIGANSSNLRCERHLTPCFCMFLPQTISPDNNSSAGPFVQLVKSYKTKTGACSGNNSYPRNSTTTNINTVHQKSRPSNGVEITSGDSGGICGSINTAVAGSESGCSNSNNSSSGQK